MHRLGAALLLLALSTLAASDPGTCSNPDKAGGGAPRPCAGVTEKIKAVAPKGLASALDDAQGVTVLLMHKGDT